MTANISVRKFGDQTGPLDRMPFFLAWLTMVPAFQSANLQTSEPSIETVWLSLQPYSSRAVIARAWNWVYEESLSFPLGRGNG